MKLLLVVVVALAIAFAALTAFGRWQWNGKTLELMSELEAGRVNLKPQRVDARELDGLPPVVQRYFHAVLRDGAPIVSAATVTHAGTFNMGETGDSWKL
ncbi:MAG: DUF6544 family protein [Giesbergeria sp.]